ncbi:MAG: membrane integrity-associated transporter subunit PqiC [Planctomycetes bacterium]|nr:membrane integrity-associated transporter subunit PqiC [Planctomycetota bacterium]
MRTKLSLSCLLALSLSGCFGGASPAPRSFRPAVVQVEPTAEVGPELRYRPPTASQHLRERMAWKLSPVEYWFSELTVWSEAPANYADRALAQRLFEGAGLRRGAAATLPTLESELREFCFDRAARAAVVELHLLLSQPEGAQLERTVRATAPVGDEEPESIARGLGAALSEACDAAAQQVVEALR